MNPLKQRALYPLALAYLGLLWLLSRILHWVGIW
jgi:hypothetical protein